MFANLIFQVHKRVIIICSTQYGKSLWTALACLVLTCVLGKKVAIIAPTADKAKLIMAYYIEHIGDHSIFYRQLEKNTKLERLRQEQSKRRIILRNGGGIFVISADQRNASKSIEAAMGAGAEVVIGDEFNLIQDDTESTIFRMIAGKGPDAFYCKIGNPFYSNPPYTHFKKSWLDPRFLQIFIDYVQAIKEGRYSAEFIEEAREKPLFDILYACEFPPEDVMDEKGYRPLILSEQLRYRKVTPDQFLAEINKARAEEQIVKPKLGADIGGGGDKNVYTVRWKNLASVVGQNQSKDTMVNVSEIESIVEKFGIDWSDVNIDDIGIGRGVSDRLKEKGYSVNGVNVGGSAQDPKFANLKAELYWKLKVWIGRSDTYLDERPEWAQLTWIKYKVNSEKQVKIESKEDMKQRTKKSPDFAESLMLTFYEPAFVGFA